MTEAASSYIPGMCNINPKEIAQRRRIGHIGLSITILLAFLLLFIDLSPWLRLIIFIPTFLAATGYLQAKNKFCVGYANAQQHHADDGTVVDIDDKSALAADKKKAQLINLQAFGIATVVAIVFTLLPL